MLQIKSNRHMVTLPHFHALLPHNTTMADILSWDLGLHVEIQICVCSSSGSSLLGCQPCGLHIKHVLRVWWNECCFPPELWASINSQSIQTEVKSCHWVDAALNIRESRFVCFSNVWDFRSWTATDVTVKTWSSAPLWMFSLFPLIYFSFLSNKQVVLKTKTKDMKQKNKMCDHSSCDFEQTVRTSIEARF